MKLSLEDEEGKRGCQEWWRRSKIKEEEEVVGFQEKNVASSLSLLFPNLPNS